ncbi:MAG: alanine--glyoxylate aminotransferase family protein [Deltaproteobacteria bacterium]|nr:alanine--glyoxylate aminotransferase family protein [Deltaproteobacteria bacterium]
MKRYLMTPGPTPVAPETQLAMATPIIHHRAPQFMEILGEVREGLKYLFQTQQEVLIFAATGTGAMEGAVANTLSAGDTALVVDGGKFGERWTELCNVYGVKPERLVVEWGRAVDPQAVAKLLDANPAIKAVFVQANETSTGVQHPVKGLAEVTRNRPGTILVVDAISALGGYELPMDEWGIDVLVAGSQKAMMLPPGLAFAALSDKAWKFVKSSTLPKYYFDFAKARKSQEKNQTPYTSPVSLILGLQEVLAKIRRDGLGKVFAHNRRLSEATKTAMAAMGLELYSKDNASLVLTAVLAPAGVDGQKVVAELRKRGIWIAGGQAQAKGKIFRIAHMGYIDEVDLVGTIAGLEIVLNQLGYKVALGTGVKAANQVLGKEAAA